MHCHSLIRACMHWRMCYSEHQRALVIICTMHPPFLYPYPIQVSHHTILSEATLASMKRVSEIMGGCGSQAAKSARVNARMSHFWDTYDELSVEEADVLDECMCTFKKWMRTFDLEVRAWLCSARACYCCLPCCRARVLKHIRTCTYTQTQTKHDEAAARRAERREAELVEEAAKAYANRLVLCKVELWEAKQVTSKLKVDGKWRLKWAGPESQVRLLKEQLGVIVCGWMHKDLAFVASSSGGSYIDRLKHHVTCALGEIRRRWKKGPGGKQPKNPPLPDICPKVKPPTLDDDQESNPVHKVGR